MRPGSRLGIDVGAVRVGVALSDPGGLLATPVETLARGEGDLARLVDLASEHDVVEVVVGLPRSLGGDEGQAAAKAREFAAALAAAVAVPVRLVDERLSTVTANAALQHSGRRGAAQGKKRRKVVDQVAAMVILQNALDTERSSGHAPGELVMLG